MQRTFSTFCVLTAIRKAAILATAVLVVFISACDSSSSPALVDPVDPVDPVVPADPPVAVDPGDSSGVNGPANQMSSSQVIAQSAIATERFGEIRERRLADDPSSEVTDAVVTAINDFSLVLHRAQANDQPDENAVASGYSMATALSFLRAGAAGATDSELANLLAQDAIDETSVHRSFNALAQTLATRNNEELVLNTANRIFAQPDLPLKTGFLDIATGEYAAPVTEVDFANATQPAIDLINEWASEQTDGFIKEIADNTNITEATQVALLNAIFLDAAWQQQFDDLSEQFFTVANGDIKRVPTFGGERTLARSVESDVTVVDIPYAGGELSMMIMMPDDLASFESTFSVARLNSIVSSLQSVRVAYSMPAFEIESLLDANKLLEPIGLPVQDLDLSDMFDSLDQELELTVQQKARIEVDQNGTRAAAVTTVGVVTTSVVQFEEISIDKPFLYLLRDTTTGVILFSGRVVDPSL